MPTDPTPSKVKLEASGAHGRLKPGGLKRCDHPRVGQQGAVKMPPPTAPPFQAPRPCFLLHHPWTFSEWSLKAHLFSVLQPTRSDIHLPRHPRAKEAWGSQG